MGCRGAQTVLITYQIIETNARKAAYSFASKFQLTYLTIERLKRILCLQSKPKVIIKSEILKNGKPRTSMRICHLIESLPY